MSSEKVTNYRRFANRIIEMIYGNDNMRYDRDTFGKEGNKLGREIYAIGGYSGLFAVMNIVEQELLDGEYSNEYLGDLRNLEVSWTGICEEWQM